MLNADLKEFEFISDFDELVISAVLAVPSGEVHGIVQLIHGLNEHKERYYPFMDYLAEQGFITVIHDNRGHGKSIVEADDLGFMFRNGGEGFVSDIAQINKRIREAYPNVPVFMIDSHTKKQGVQYGTIKRETYFSKKANKNKPYNILLPANYDSSKKYPVLYLLHGFFENENRMITQGNGQMYTQQIIGNAIAEGAAKDMIVVVPFVFTSATMNDATGFADQGSNEGYDNFVDDIVDSLMPHIESKYSVATGRENTAVTGFSMGGRESLQIGMKYGSKFGYVGAICPAPGASGSWKWSNPDETPYLVMITGGTQPVMISNVVHLFE